jgi:hypothetical protein
VRLIADCAGLDGIETMILDFAEKRALTPLFSDFLRETSSNGMRNNYAFLASALGLPAAALKRAFGRSGTLRNLGLLRAPGVRDDLEDFVTPDDLLTEILTLAPESTEALLAMIVEPAPASAWSLPDFPTCSVKASACRACWRRPPASAPRRQRLALRPAGHRQDRVRPGRRPRRRPRHLSGQDRRRRR